MKKYFFLVFFLIVTSYTAQAQLSFNIFSGVNYSWQSSRLQGFSNESFENNISQLDGKVTNPFVGLLLKKRVNGFLDLNFEFQYSLKGQKINSGLYKETLNYLKYQQTFDINVWKNIKVGGGMFWAYKLQSEFEGLSPVSSFNRENWDTGIVSSLSCQYKRFTFRVLYQYSITKLYRLSLFTNFGQFLGNAYKYNRNLQFGFGYNFSKNKSKLITQSLF